MSFRFLCVLASLSLIVVATQAGCNSDRDCAENWDCVHLGLASGFKKVCVPLTCTKGATYALLESGFNAEEYIATLRDSYLRRSIDFMPLTKTNTVRLGQALAANPIAGMDVVNENLTACLNPKTRDGSRRLEDNVNDARRVQTGLMWGFAGPFSYFGKSSWSSSTDEATGRSVGFQYINNCIGTTFGVDLGIDVMLQYWFFRRNDNLMDPFDFDPSADPQGSSGDDDNPSNQQQGGKTVRFNPGDTQCAPYITLGPFAWHACFLNGFDIEMGQIVEFTVGPASLGANCCGYYYCWNEAVVNTNF